MRDGEERQKAHTRTGPRDCGDSVHWHLFAA
jgi:hypothetical protein